MRSCSFACFSISASKSASGSENIMLIASYSFNIATVSAAPSSTISRTVFVGSSAGSCSSRPNVIPFCALICPS